ncbi:MAG: response regulator [Rhodanobacteraceae bacterium]
MAVFNIFKRLVNQNAASDERRDGERLRATLGARVLVVDDSATIRVVLAKMLMQDGYEVFKAGDGESAVEMAQTQPPDLIFLDIVLPGMSGFAVLRALRRDSRTRDVPIIMMSGNQQATEQFYVQRFGADGFIKKPFGRVEVFHAVRSLVQAGRMPGRVETTPANVIPDDMTPEEWNAIPDVAMPDEAHRAEQSPAVVDAVASEDEASTVAPTPDDPHAASPVSAQSAQPLAQPSIAAPASSSWTLAARSMPMRPSLATASASPERPSSPAQAGDTDKQTVSSEQGDDKA